MTERRRTIWQKVDLSVLAKDSTKKAPPDTDEEKRRKARRRRRWIVILDVIGALVWLYVFLKLFVFDVDRAIIEQIAPNALEVLNYRFFFLLAVVALVVLIARRYWVGLLYIVFFPFIVLFWKIPRLIYRTKSWLALLAVINVIASFVKDFKFNFVTKSLAVFCILGVLTSDRVIVLVPASVTLFALLLIAFYRNIRASFSPSQFIDLQVTFLEKVSEADGFANLVDVAQDLKQPSIKKFDEAQLRRFAGNLQNGMLAVRGVYFWAYQLERYRQSPAVSFFSFGTYAWLFVITVVTVWMFNLSMLELDPALFQFSDYLSSRTTPPT
jgi:hypothetical protein